MLKKGPLRILSLIALFTLLAWSGAAPGRAGSLRLETSDPGTVAALRVNPQDTDTVYAATGLAGVLKTNDNGLTWTAKNSGLPTRTVHDLAVDPVTPSNLYLATASGAYRSIDGAETWEALDLGIQGLECTALALIPGLEGVVLVGTAANGVFGSNDYGQTWVPLGGGEDGPVNDLAVTPVSLEQSRRFDDGTGDTFITWKADKNGVSRLETTVFPWAITRSWEKTELSNAWIYSLLVGVKGVRKAAAIWVGVSGYGIRVSLDNGKTWKVLPTPGGDINVNDLAERPQSKSSALSALAETEDLPDIYAASYDGFVLKGVNKADNWTWTYLLGAAVLGLDSLHPRAITTVSLPDNADGPQGPALWVGTFSGLDEIGPHSGGIYYSPDDGATWTAALAGGYLVND